LIKHSLFSFLLHRDRQDWFTAQVKLLSCLQLALARSLLVVHRVVKCWRERTVANNFDRRSLLAAIAATGALSMVEGPALAARGKLFFKQLGVPIGLQLYTLGDEPAKDLDGVLSKLATMGYHDLELPSLFGKTPTVLKAAADKAGVKFSSIHLAAMQGMPGADPNALTLLSPTQRIVDDLGILGVKSAVMPIFALPADFGETPGASFKEKIANSLAKAGADHWKKTADLLNEKALALKPAGISVGYHNHNLEFAPVGGTTGWDILVSRTDAKLVHFEVDIGWIAAAGLEPVAFLKKYSGRFRWMHVKDLKASSKPNFALNMDPTEVGSGQQNWAAILPAAHKAGVRHFYVEQEPPFSMPRMDAAAKSFGYLSKLAT
jgi:sugar phosphate isomerase/epimerase